MLSGDPAKANLNLKRSILKTNDSNISSINYSSSTHIGFKTLEGKKGGSSPKKLE
jgi:hypothetical protein